MKRIFVELTILFTVLFSINANISEFSIKHQLNSKIDNTNHSIFIEVPYTSKTDYFNLSKSEIEKIVFDNDSSCDLKTGNIIDLRKKTSFIVIEDESKTTWTIQGGYQLPESDFTKWHTEKLPGFLTFGSKTCSEMPGSTPICWDNGNPAFSASGSKKWPTKQFVLPDGSIAAELITRKVIGVIASGNLFTGEITRKMGLKQLLGFTDKDGKALIDWGVPFEARPKGIRVKFFYDGLGKDECSIVATLENRNNNQRKYVASASYIGFTDNENECNCITKISDYDENSMRTLEIDFMYGELPEHSNPLPENVIQANANEDITHVNVVFASSAHGDFFKGTKNARLLIKDFEFVY